MAKVKKHSPEQIVTILRQIEVGVANGKTYPVAGREAGVTEQTYYRWRKEYGGLQVGSSRRQLSGGGWPVWQGDVAPYGQELNPEVSVDSSKFATLERDAETGMDHACFYCQ